MRLKPSEENTSWVPQLVLQKPKPSRYQGEEGDNLERAFFVLAGICTLADLGSVSLHLIADLPSSRMYYHHLTEETKASTFIPNQIQNCPD